ncbi:hypothetical protein RhiirA5_416793 [Rhizophagus irregularis]|uniref:Uncharacterized protein n=1 Tax=Rhizophagus irregularis TaxID=588596 RepID=A0A2N0PP07_9GLOM|nr:hypothetical protein RhiirA5_416793 [Rhizophagus irregularis]
MFLAKNVSFLYFLQKIGSDVDTEIGSSVDADIPEFGSSVDANIPELSSNVDADIPVKKSVLAWIPIFQEFSSSVDADISDKFQTIFETSLKKKHFLTFFFILNCKAIGSSGYQFRCGYQNPKGNRLLLEYQIPKEFGFSVDADIPVKDTRIGSDLDTNPTSKEIGFNMDAKISSVRFKTPSKYNRGLGHGMVDDFPLRLFIGWVSINELGVSHPSDFIEWADKFSSSDFIGWVSPSDFIRSGFLRIFIRLGEDDGWMMDGGWCI